MRSELGKGSEFHFTLPLHLPKHDAKPVPKMGQRRILIVDDDPDIRQLLEDRLSADGYWIETAVDGVYAMERLQVNAYDGVIRTSACRISMAWSYSTTFGNCTATCRSSWSRHLEPSSELCKRSVWALMPSC